VFLKVKDWPWWGLLASLRPLLSSTLGTEQLRAKEVGSVLWVVTPAHLRARTQHSGPWWPLTNSSTAFHSFACRLPSAETVLPQTQLLYGMLVNCASHSWATGLAVIPVRGLWHLSEKSLPSNTHMHTHACTHMCTCVRAHTHIQPFLR
jgi:hypothetical protein